MQTNNSPPQSNTAYASLIPRSTHEICIGVDSSQKIVISRTTLIAAISVCVIITCASTLALAVLLYREWARHQEKKKKQASNSWEQSPRFEHRISSSQKEINSQYLRQYSGCLYQEPGNPSMRSNAPVELMNPERLCEAPATPVQTIEKGQHKSKRATLFFDQALGLWTPRK